MQTIKIHFPEHVQEWNVTPETGDLSATTPTHKPKLPGEHTAHALPASSSEVNLQPRADRDGVAKE